MKDPKPYQSPVSAFHVQIILRHLRGLKDTPGIILDIAAQMESDMGIEWQDDNYQPKGFGASQLEFLGHPIIANADNSCA